MNRFLQSMFGKNPQPIRSTKSRGTLRLGVEALENRVLMARHIGGAPEFVLPPGLVVTVTTGQDNGAGSLRSAITTIDNDHLLRSSPDEINFDNTGAVDLASPLPALTRGDLIINGTNEATSLRELLVGRELFSSMSPVNGLTIDGSGTTVENLDLVWCDNGIVIAGQGGDVLQDDSFGYANSTLFTNARDGVWIDNAANNTISGCNFAGNTLGGIEIDGAGATGNTVQGNTIGTDPTGTKAPGGQDYGVVFDGFNANTTGQPSNTTIIGNIISGNHVQGVQVEGGHNVVEDNFIGTDFSGEKALPNGIGIVDFGASTVIDNNVISGNANEGVELGGTSAIVQGNLIGTNDGGAAALANGSYGVYVTGSNNVIGGTTYTDRNVIVGAATTGAFTTADIFIDGTGDPSNSMPVTGNLIEGNYLGTNAKGTSDLGAATEDGVGIQGPYASKNVIGGTAAGAGNLISGAAYAIFISDQQGQLAGLKLVGQNTIQGNLIDTNATGKVKLFAGTGIVLLDTVNNTIGGTTAGSGNVIAVGANKAGIWVQNSSTGNQALGNYIGVALDGTTNLGDESATGILFGNATGNTTTGNTIGFCGTGIESDASGNTANGNTITYCAVGIELDGFTGNTTDKNTITYCGIGIDHIKGNTVQNNNFAHDTKNTTN